MDGKKNNDNSNNRNNYYDSTYNLNIKKTTILMQVIIKILLILTIPITTISRDKDINKPI